VVARTRPHEGSAAGRLTAVATDGTVPAVARGPSDLASASSCGPSGLGRGSMFSSMPPGGAVRLSSPTFATLRPHVSAAHAPQQSTRTRRYQRKTPIGNECIAQYAGTWA
jgi:hypothetical protein